MSMIEERQWNTVDLDETRISKKSFPRILYGKYWAGSMIFPPPFSFRYRWKRWKKFQDGPVVFARGKITVRCVTRINLFSSRFLSRKHFSSELFFSSFFFARARSTWFTGRTLLPFISSSQPLSTSNHQYQSQCTQLSFSRSPSGTKKRVARHLGESLTNHQEVTSLATTMSFIHLVKRKNEPS